jgi:hypothetical protein
LRGWTFAQTATTGNGLASLILGKGVSQRWHLLLSESRPRLFDRMRRNESIETKMLPKNAWTAKFPEIIVTQGKSGPV